MIKEEYEEILKMIHIFGRYSYGFSPFEVSEQFEKKFREKFGKEVGKCKDKKKTLPEKTKDALNVKGESQ